MKKAPKVKKATVPAVDDINVETVETKCAVPPPKDAAARPPSAVHLRRNDDGEGEDSVDVTLETEVRLELKSVLAGKECPRRFSLNILGKEVHAEVKDHGMTVEAIFSMAEKESVSVWGFAVEKEILDGHHDVVKSIVRVFQRRPGPPPQAIIDGFEAKKNHIIGEILSPVFGVDVAQKLHAVLHANYGYGRGPWERNGAIALSKLGPEVFEYAELLSQLREAKGLWNSVMPRSYDFHRRTIPGHVIDAAAASHSLGRPIGKMLQEDMTPRFMTYIIDVIVTYCRWAKNGLAPRVADQVHIIDDHIERPSRVGRPTLGAMGVLDGVLDNVNTTASD